MLEAENSVLTVIDVQGKLADVMQNRDELFGNINRLAFSANRLKVPVLITEQLPDKLGPTREELAEELINTPVISKSSFSCCGEPAFMDELNKTENKQVILCGIESHICVTQTALDLIEAGYEVYVVADAVSSRNPESKQLTLERLRRHGVEIIVTESVIFEWMRDAAHPAFREVRKCLA